MFQSRIKSSKILALPQTRQSIQRRSQFIKQYQRSLFSQQHNRSPKRQISTAPFQLNHDDKILHNKFRLKIKHPEMDIQDQQRSQSVKFRPYTELKKEENKRLRSPLSIMRPATKITSQKSHLSLDNLSKNNYKIRVNFLKKGTSIDKAIIMNVLKSKSNLNVCTSTFSYTNDPRNIQLIKMIQKQIPRGIRDIVGAQQMLRMSHIMTGAQFNSVNMTKQLNFKLKQKIKLAQHYNQVQDTMTLKSIKRW